MNKLTAEKCREEFEAWAKTEGLINETFGIRSVNETFLNTCWTAWQASRQALEIALPLLEQQESRRQVTLREAVSELRNLTDESGSYNFEALRAEQDDSNWISCSERMPEIGSTILVHMEDPIHSATPYAVATYDKYGFSRSKVTHWQSLPASPTPQPSTNPQIDNEDWIEWKGGDCPVDDEVRVHLRWTDGSLCTARASNIRWSRRKGFINVSAYRVIENDEREA